MLLKGLRGPRHSQGSLCDPKSAQGQCCPSPRQPCSGAAVPLSRSRGPLIGLEGQAVAPQTEILCSAQKAPLCVRPAETLAPGGRWGGGCPQSLLLSLVLKHLEQAGPGLFAGPVGAAGETGWHPARPAPLRVPTALCAAAHAVLAVWQGGPLPPAHPPR